MSVIIGGCSTRPITQQLDRLGQTDMAGRMAAGSCPPCAVVAFLAERLGEDVGAGGERP
jgi:hypothetical protein